ncbi:MAG: IS3 family transposase, partial [Actinobacteria bacterium]|nr:IS3 family transposase [Actinomycetota bacterium]
MKLRYEFIFVEKAHYPVTILCKTMQVHKSGYYGWLKCPKSAREIKNEELIPLVREIFSDSHETYGTRRIAKALEGKEISCSRARARTLMKLAGIKVKKRRKFKTTTNSKHKLPVAPNLLEQDFTVDKPNKVWVSDLTYVQTYEGWLYLVIVLDLFSRQIVGWSMDKYMTKELVINAFNMAYWKRSPEAGLIFHSDRGSQYCSFKFQRRLASCSAVSSMSGKGNCFDNAPSESFFGSLKTERVYFANYQTREEARLDIVDYIEMFYNS